MLRLGGLSVYRNSVPVVNELSAELHAGGVYHLLGANGSGKSSLLAAVAGLLPSRGQCLLTEQPLLNLDVIQQAGLRALLLQQNTVRSRAVVRDYLALSNVLRPVTASVWDNRLMQLATELDCQALLARRIDQLSGGERQRIEIARVLLQVDPELNHHARLLMLDEPLTGLDFPHQIRLLTTLRQLADGGLIVLMAHHDLNTAVQWADQVLLMRAGTLLVQGAVEQVMQPDWLYQAFAYRCQRLTVDHHTFIVPIAQ